MGQFELLLHNLNLLLKGTYSPLCVTFPAWYVQLVVVLDLMIFSPYVVVGCFLVSVQKLFNTITNLGKLMNAYGLSLVFCGLAHVTGIMAELGNYVHLDLVVKIATAFLSVRAAVLTFMHWSEVSYDLKILSAALIKIHKDGS